MKKIKLLFMMIFAFLVVSPNVLAANVAPDIKSYAECSSYGDYFKAINTDYYYKACYEVRCSYGVANRRNLTTSSGYKCNNGNGQPYVNVVSDKCSAMLGSCNTELARYCATITYVDCTRKSDGSAFETPTKPTTTAPTTTTTTKVSSVIVSDTKKPTTTTTKRVDTPKPTEPVTEAPLSSNTNLKQLVIGGVEVKYDNTKTLYTVKIPYEIADLEINAVPEDERTQVSIKGNTDMPAEDTNVEIKITAQNGEEKIVTLSIKRYNGENDDCSLANIFIENYPIEFDKNVFEYTLVLPKDVKSLEISAVPTDELYSKVDISGNEKLKNKSKINILVVAQDGTKCNYTIKIKKENNAWKYIVLIILLIGGLGVSSYILYRYLKKSKGKYKYE